MNKILVIAIAKKLLTENTKINNIHDLEKTNIFYLNPIIAWHISKTKCLIGEEWMFWGHPILPGMYDAPNFNISGNNILLEKIIEAKNSFIIKEYDSDLEAYYVDGCIAAYGEGYCGLQDFFEKRLKEIIKMQNPGDDS